MSKASKNRSGKSRARQRIPNSRFAIFARYASGTNNQTSIEDHLVSLRQHALRDGCALIADDADNPAARRSSVRKRLLRLFEVCADTNGDPNSSLHISERLNAALNVTKGASTCS
jgi:hypothetical protein